MTKKLIYWIQLSLIFSFPIQGKASDDIFFNPIDCEYLGPDTIYVGSICTGLLFWDEPNNPVCMSNNPGGVIISRNLHAISGGYSIGDDVPAGTDVEIVYRVTDNMGNIYFFEFVISFVDTISPVFTASTLPQDTFLINSGDYPPTDVKATDNCDLNGDSLLIEFEDSPLPNGCMGGNWTRTYTVTDPFGNQTGYTQNIFQIPDTIPPVFIIPPQDTAVMCTDLPGAFNSWLTSQYNSIEVINEAGGAVIIEDKAPDVSFFENFCGAVEIEFSATDSCGNSTTVVVQFEVFDPDPPVIVKQAEPLILNCADSNAKMTLEEWLASNGFSEFSDACGIQNIYLSPAPGDSLFVCNDLIEVKWIAEDICGQTTESSVVVLIADNEPPQVDISPANLVVDCFAANLGEQFFDWLYDAGGAQFNDNCSPDEWLSVSYKLDGQPMEAEELWEELISGFQTACADTLVIDSTIILNVLSSIEVEFVFSDLCGNSVSYFANFVAVDNQAPIITQQAHNLMIDCGNDSEMYSQIESWYNNFGGIQADDDCSAVFYGANLSLSQFWDNFLISRDTLCGNNGISELVFYAEDQCGNRRFSNQINRVITVDTIPPALIESPTDLIINCNLSKDSILTDWILNLGGAELSEECGSIVPLAFEYLSNNGDFGAGTILDGPYPSLNLSICNEFWNFNFSVADGCGNTLEFSAMVFIEDSVPPDFSGSQDTAFYNCIDDTGLLQLSVEDFCSSFEVSYSDSLVSDETFGCGDFELLIRRKFAAEDVCGNTAVFDQWVVVGDFEAPEFILPPDTSVDCSKVDDLTITGVPSGITDNCFSLDDITVDFSDEEFGEICNRFIQRTWTVYDPCGNTSSGIQLIFTLDTLKPKIHIAPLDLQLECGSPDNLSLLEDWLEANGGLVAEAGCADYKVFAAISGSWEFLPDGTLDFSPPSLPELMDCADIEGTAVGMVVVDFILVDECGNYEIASSEVVLVDSSPPEIFNCSDSYTVLLDEGECSGLFFKPGLVFYDRCAGGDFFLEKTDSVFLSSADSLDPSLLVDTVFLVFSDLHQAFSSIQSITLKVELIGVDGEQPTEFFNVFDDNGNNLGQTELTDEQCGYSITTITISDSEYLNALVENGQMIFTLIPFSSDSLAGSFFINDICDPGLVKGSLELEFKTSSNLDVNYRINYEPEVNWNSFPENGIELAAGDHSFLIVAEDCSGNRSHCFAEIFIQSNDLPQIFCGPDTSGFADEDCLFSLIAPQVNYSHPCFGTGKTYFSHSADEFAWLEFSLHPDFNLFQMDEMEIAIEISGPSLGQGVYFYLDFIADLDTLDNWIQLVLPDGQILGNTKNDYDEKLRKGSCNDAGLIRFFIEDSLFNNHIQNDVFSVTLRQNPNLPFVPGSMTAGINPCILPDGFDGGSDGQSYVRAYLRYHPVDLSIEVSNNDHLEIFQLVLGESMPEMELPFGSNQLKYVVTDPWGNKNSCSFEVEVVDTIRPVAVCKNSLVVIRPSITESIALTPEIIDGGSSDNCGIADYYFVPEFISCTDAGSDKTIVMIIEDFSGNKDSCSALLKVEMLSLNPQFSLNLCNPDTLFLFSDFSENGSAYSYQWSGPANFSSTQANPILSGVSPLNSGIYNLTVTGFGGCQAFGSVNVNISPIATPVIAAAASVVCEGDDIVLTSSSFSGPITYRWYRGVFPSGVLLGSTAQPGFSVNLPAGTHRFYVIAENPDCSSNPSSGITVEVVEEPVAVIDPSLIRVCEGQPLTLSSPLGPSFNFQWSGPSGFISDLANPLVTNMAGATNAGNYFLIVGLGSCLSVPVSAEVVVEDSPEKPLINGNGLICVGDSLQLRVPNIPTATRYTWILPDGSEVFTSINQIIINNANIALSGDWRVKVAFGDCESPESLPFSVLVENAPVAEIFTNSPVCQGDTVLLVGSGLFGGQYQWSGPGGFTYSGDTVFQPLPTGNYHLTITSTAGCRGTASVSVVNKLRPEIQALIPQGFDCVDGSSDYCLQSVTSPANDPSLVFNWSGPLNFSSNQSTACISNITEENNGIYELIVSLDGCESEKSAVEVDVTDIGFTPQISANALTLCQGDSLVLNSNVQAGPGVRFNWITPLGPILTTSPRLVVHGLTPAESGVYALFVSIESCSTGLSQELNVIVNPRPVTPVISGGGSYCTGDSIVLNAGVEDGTLYFWMGPGTLQQGNATQVLWPANPSMNGQYFVTALKDGCSSLVPATTTLVVKPLPAAPGSVLTPSRVCLDGDRIPIEICVPGDSLVGGARVSYFLNNELNDPIFTTFSLCGLWDDYGLLEEGSNSIRARLEVDGCWSDFGPPVDLRADAAPDISAFAGESFFSCDKDKVVISAGIADPAVGQWSSPDFDLIFIDKNEAFTEVSGLKSGKNKLIWSLSSGICRNFDRDTLIIDYLAFPIANNLSVSIVAGEQATIEPLFNDFFVSDVNFQILNIEGNIVVEGIDEDLIIVYTDERWSGPATIQYSICLEDCPEKCSQALITIVVGDENDCEVPNIFTPNRDGINDSFIVSCLSGDRYPNNRVSIYDQWGSEVFSASPYLNDWEGMYNGRDLPEGTYFYVIKFDSGKSPVSGFVVIKR